MVLFVIGMFNAIIFQITVYRIMARERNSHQSDFILSFWGFLYFNIAMFAGKYVYFLNGINALRIQF